MINPEPQNYNLEPLQNCWENYDYIVEFIE